MEGDKKNSNKQTILGRQKIEIKRIRKNEDRVTTFFKRRSGIYKKAAEISALCGAEVAFGAFSPAGNAFAFATSSMDSIADRFLTLPRGDLDADTMSASRREGLKERYNELEGRLAAERELSKGLEKAEGEEEIMGWWETPIEQLRLGELLKVDESMKKLHKKLLNHINGEKTPAGHGDGNSGENPT